MNYWNTWDFQKTGKISHKDPLPPFHPANALLKVSLIIKNKIY